MKYFLAILISCFAGAQTIDLSGQWRFCEDADDVGQSEKWNENVLPGQDEIFLPGSMQSQGFGENPGMETDWTASLKYELWNEPQYAPYKTDDNFKMPFFLQADKYYTGAAWYQKTISIPSSFKGKHITLTLERTHWETTVWLDSKPIGSSNHLSVAHRYDLSEYATPGKHLLTIRVDNSDDIISVGRNSHSITDHTQSNWNGIVGKIEITCTDPIWIDNLQVYPDLSSNSAKVVARVFNSMAYQDADVVFDVLFDGKKIFSKTIPFELANACNGDVIEANLENLTERWNEFTPNLYTLKATVKSGFSKMTAESRFGMREIKVVGNKIMLNGKKIFLRGTLECCIFPKTGYPPTDVVSWKRIINICKSHGLNHIRFHSWCPPEEAFVAADELGFYYQVECSSWANGESSVGDGRDVDSWLYDEADAILKDYGNSPSFVLFDYGNEPGGKNRNEYLGNWVAHYKSKDNRRIVTSGSGWPIIEQNDYNLTMPPRIQGWGQELKSRINSKAPETASDYSWFVNKYPNQATVSHEIGQWCVYPDFTEIEKYTGVLKPKNFEIFRDFLENKNMLAQARDFFMASGKLQTLCYKEDIESALRTPNFGGFQLLDLHDFPGQGTALVGVLDPFWNSKPYVTPEQYKQFSGPVVPLARMAKRTFKSSEKFEARIDVSQFGPADMKNVELCWSIVDAGGVAVRSGALTKSFMPAGDLYVVGDISAELSGLPVPAQYKLNVEIMHSDYANNWDFWVYPDKFSKPNLSNVLVANSLDDEAVAFLNGGGNVLLAANPADVKTDEKIGFSSIFWNTAWTDRQAPHTLGILCDPKHPALAAFPTEYHSNWQWSLPMQNAATMEMDNLPQNIAPIVQVVPDWFGPKKLGLVFEAKVGKGGILVCSVNLSGNLEKDLPRRQMKQSLLEYISSDAFNPEVEVDIQAIRELFK